MPSSTLTEKTLPDQIAYWVSHIISPHIVGTLALAWLTLWFSTSPGTDLLWLLLVIPLILVPPLSYVLWLVRRGVLTDMYMPNRANRIRPMAVIIGWLLFCLFLLGFVQPPEMVETVVTIAILLIVVLSLITLFWKISFHTATIAAVVTVMIFVGGWYATPALLLLPLVGWSRIHLKRHTPRQVVIGSALGILIVVLMVWYGPLVGLL